MSLLHTIDYLKSESKQAQQEEVDDYVDFVVNRISARIQEDVEVELINGKVGTLYYTVPKIPRGQAPNDILKYVQEILEGVIDVDLSVSFNSPTRVSVNLLLGG